MAERMQYEVPPPRTEPDAHESLSALLESLHHHGFLRLAKDLVTANTQIANVLVEGLNKQGSQNAVQNISLLMMALSSIPPEQFNQIVMAVKNALLAVGEEQKKESRQSAPGIKGFIKLLRDDELWNGIRPLFAGVKAFSTEMQAEPEKPISRYSGKESRA